MLRQAREPGRRVAAALIWACVATAHAQSNGSAPACGSLNFGYGPFDYRTDRDKLPIVEQYHFSPAVEAMVKPMFTTIASDLSYTLKAFPNHHRALVTLVRNSERLKSLQPPGADYSVDCYFERALRFRADDLVVRLIYADFLVRQNRGVEATKQIDYVVSEAGDNMLTHFNAGLIYLSLAQFDKASAQALKVEQLGGDPVRLREKLKAAGREAEKASEGPKTRGPN